MLNRSTNCWEDGEEGGINFNKMVRKISQRRNNFKWALKVEQMWWQWWCVCSLRKRGQYGKGKSGILGRRNGIRKDKVMGSFMPFWGNREQSQVTGGIEFAKMVWGQILGLQSPFHMHSSEQNVGDKLPRYGYCTSSLALGSQDPLPHTYRRLLKNSQVNGAGRPDQIKGGVPGRAP